MSSFENITSVVPFFGVADIQRSVDFYVKLLGFRIVYRWDPEGQLRWCWLTRGGASLMLQTRQPDEAPRGLGVALWFQCQDALALYDELLALGVPISEPQVGNGNWETGVTDPDGYRLHFSSPADAPEETRLSAYRARS